MRGETQPTGIILQAIRTRYDEISLQVGLELSEDRKPDEKECFSNIKDGPSKADSEDVTLAVPGDSGSGGKRDISNLERKSTNEPAVSTHPEHNFVGELATKQSRKWRIGTPQSAKPGSCQSQDAVAVQHRKIGATGASLILTQDNDQGKNPPEHARMERSISTVDDLPFTRTPAAKTPMEKAAPEFIADIESEQKRCQEDTESALAGEDALQHPSAAPPDVVPGTTHQNTPTLKSEFQQYEYAINARDETEPPLSQVRAHLQRKSVENTEEASPEVQFVQEMKRSALSRSDFSTRTRKTRRLHATCAPKAEYHWRSDRDFSSD